MARRQAIKREATQQPAASVQDSLRADEASCAQHDQPVSTGNTISLDDSSDVTMTDGLVDEGYQIGNGKKMSGKSYNSVRHTMPKPHNASIIDSLDDTREDSEGGLQLLGRGVKKLVQAVQALRHLGIENLDLPLPKIVVVGDQSTGKSSLIEGISEIKVPRSAGTCTRCPLEINLTEQTTGEGQWSCEVILHMKYHYDRGLGNAKSVGATRARPLGPWMRFDGEDLPFAYLTSKDDIKDTLERAQLAILNPSSSFEKYKPGTSLTNRAHQVKFSPNIIRLDITGPGLPNLSFFDLPGVINVSEVPDEAYLVDLVRNLVKDYVRTPDCINLLALTMTHDVANSSAFGLIQEMKAESRTVGCLTKPDMMATKEPLDQWSQILGGEAFKLRFGYHVIKNNSNPNVDHATARQEEASFFNTQEPWTTELHSFDGCFGTLRLQTALSQRLTAQIQKSLPLIIEQVQSKAEDIRLQLNELPEPLGNHLAVTVMGELVTFERFVEKAIDGGKNEFPFQKDWDAVARKLRQDLADTHPMLIFSTPSTPGRRQESSPVGAGNTTPIAIDSDDEDGHQVIHSKLSPGLSRSNKRSSSFLSQPTPTKFLKTLSGASQVLPARKGSKLFYLPEVRDICQGAYKGGIHKISPEAIERMIVISMQHWKYPLDQFFIQTRKLCEGVIFEQFQKVYGKYSQTQYYNTILQICETFFEKAFYEQRQLVDRILNWEQSRPKTYNDKAMGLAEMEALTILRKKSRDMRAHAFLNAQERKSGKPSTGQARMEKLEKVTDAQLSQEGYSQEIEAISVVKAYYECAYYRFVDTVGASVHCELFGKCRKDIAKEMRKVFRLTEDDAEERLADLLAADPTQEQRRTQLKKDLDTITKAQERLDDLMIDE